MRTSVPKPFSGQCVQFHRFASESKLCTQYAAGAMPSVLNSLTTWLRNSDESGEIIFHWS